MANDDKENREGVSQEEIEEAARRARIALKNAESTTIRLRSERNYAYLIGFSAAIFLTLTIYYSQVFSRSDISLIPTPYGSIVSELVLKAAIDANPENKDDINRVYNYLKTLPGDDLAKIAGSADKCSQITCYSVNPETIERFATSILNQRNNEATLFFAKQQAEAGRQQAIVAWIALGFSFLSVVIAAAAAKAAIDANNK